MNTWQKVWREGLAPMLSTSGLHALRRALVADDERLMQGDTTSPPYLESLQDEAVQAAWDNKAPSHTERRLYAQHGRPRLAEPPLRPCRR